MATTLKNKKVKSLPKTKSLQGEVNFFSKDHGFGFIRLKETGEDFFVHMSHIMDAIKEADEVIFDIEEGIKGLIATKVRLA